MSERVLVTSQLVKTEQLKTHPRNPRRGNVPAIADSLTHHGQYRPIVVQKSTNFILAGNHTFEAAKSLGWDTVACTLLDVDNQTAERILIADNRTSDLASYDNNALSALLHSLPDLDGTGFGQLDLDKLDGVFDEVDEPEPKPTPEPKPKATIQIGIHELWVDETPLNVWRSRFTEMEKRAGTELIRSLLGFPDIIKPNPKDRHSPENVTAQVETVPIKTLIPFDGNAREGDIGAIVESLKHLGQYRPVVARRETNQILVGNHTWRAAKHLGWKNIAVAWVDVDDEQATRIVLVDNRTSDISGYDDSTLLALLTNVSSLEGTGFTPEDLDDLLNDIKTDRDHKPTPNKDVRCRVDKWSFKVSPTEFSAWSTKRTDAETPNHIATSLGLPDGSWTTENPQ
jgi:ParB-like chromosome segregation protein Spo0J